MHSQARTYVIQQHYLSIGSIFLHYQRYITNVILYFGFKDIHEVSIPIDTHAKLWKNRDLHDSKVNVLYQQGVGCLTYTIIITQPNIDNVVNKVLFF